MRCLLDKVTANAKTRLFLHCLLSAQTKTRLYLIHFVVTFDQAMINNWSVQQAAIQQRLTAMQSDIPPPYCHVSLPKFYVLNKLVSSI